MSHLVYNLLRPCTEIRGFTVIVLQFNRNLVYFAELCQTSKLMRRKSVKFIINSIRVYLYQPYPKKANFMRILGGSGKYSPLKFTRSN